MAKKAKEPKSEKPEEETKKKITKANLKSVQKESLEVFSEQFYTTLSTFTNFYQEVLQQKSETKGSDLSTEFVEVRARVSRNLQEASTKILSAQLVSLESWIEEQQKRLTEEIKKIENAHQATHKSLASTGAFTESEIKDQLTAINKKIEEKRATLEQYGDLLRRSREIYQ